SGRSTGGRNGGGRNSGGGNSHGCSSLKRRHARAAPRWSTGGARKEVVELVGWQLGDDQRHWALATWQWSTWERLVRRRACLMPSTVSRARSKVNIPYWLLGERAEGRIPPPPAGGYVLTC